MSSDTFTGPRFGSYTRWLSPPPPEPKPLDSVVWIEDAQKLLSEGASCVCIPETYLCPLHCLLDYAADAARAGD